MNSLLATLQAMDIRVLEFIRTTFIIDTSWFRVVLLVFSDIEPLFFALFLLGLWFSGVSVKHDGPKHVALDIFWHVLGAFAFYWIFNHFMPLRPRPETMSSLPPLITHFPDNSFPSGHAIFWGASWWALHILLGRSRVTWTFFILGFITCFMRIIAGIHYPFDILVGFFLGWGIVHILMILPHGKNYRQYAQDLPIRIARYL